VTRNDVILGIAAAVLVGYALLVSIGIPRRKPGFPGTHMKLVVLIAVLLIVAMLTAVLALGESHHFTTAEGGTGTTEQPATTTGGTPTSGTTSQAATPTETGGGGPAGNPAAGKEIFTASAQPPCSSCHTLSEAGATGQVGPNLDDVLKGKDAAFIHESIVDPNAEIASGFSAGIMPETYGDQLSDPQLNDLVAFLVQSTSS
jgi:mono/diheme cytochrome c family protein